MHALSAGRRSALASAHLLLSTSATALALFAAQSALAQEAPAAAATADEEIIVTGFRASVRTAIAAKRTADVFIESVTAEDIGRLPDVSIAEALARLPGVTSQRTGGQASAINIRGLSQDLVSSTLNGREQVATSGNRVIEFDQYPSELVNRADVYKSPKASQIEGGIAGKVELQTVRPLATGRRVFNINLRGSFNDSAGDNPDANAFGYRLSGSYQDQFLDNRLGIAVGYARLVQPNVATRFTGYDYRQRGTGGLAPLDLNADGVNDRIPNGFEVNKFGGTETRDGVIGVLEYEPIDNLHIMVDGYYSKFRSDVRRRGVRIDGLWDTADASQFSNPVFAGTALIGTTVTNTGSVQFRTLNQDESRNDELYTLGGNVRYDFERVHLNFDVGYSKGSSFFNNSGINSDNIAPTSLTYRLNGADLPTISTPADFTTLATNTASGFYIVPQYDTDELQSYAADVLIDADVPLLRSVEFGVRYSMRNARRIVSTFPGFNFAGRVTVPAADATISAFNGAFARAGFPAFAAFDIDAVFDANTPPGPNREGEIGQFFGFTEDQSFRIREKVIAGYVQANVDTSLFGLPITGNVGLRIVSTDQSSTSAVQLNGNRLETARGDDFVDFLPSANFVVKLGENDQIRLSGSRQISRPRFFELRNSANISVNNAGIPSGDGGNPQLSPFRATQADIGYEHYFAQDGIFSLGVYYKKLDSYILTQTLDSFNFAGAGFTLPPPTSTQTAPTQPIGIYTTPFNTNGGNVWGIEVNLTKQLSFLPAPFDGLGVILNYAFADSSIPFRSNLSGQDLAIPLPGLSRHVANPTLYFDRNGFQTRVALRYRSPFVSPQIGLSENIANSRSETVVDWQASYEFPETSKFNGLTLLLQANNLTNEPTRTFWGESQLTGTYQQFGRQFFFGASFTY